MYERFDDSKIARETVTAGVRRYDDSRVPLSMDNIAGQAVYWKGRARGPIKLSFLIDDFYVVIAEMQGRDSAGRDDAIRANQPHARDQLRRLAAAVVSEYKGK
jgi:hypothetical protein